MVINSQNLLPVIHFLLQSSKGSITFLKNPLTEDHIQGAVPVGSIAHQWYFLFCFLFSLKFARFFSSNDFIIMNTTFYVYRGLLG